MEHEIEVIWNAGWDDDPDWKVVCTCSWECWNQPTEQGARTRHFQHVAVEGLREAHVACVSTKKRPVP